MQENNEIFSYTYSAKEQEEIKNIRKKYAPPTMAEASIEKLRRLDESATKGAAVVSIIIGIIGTLLFGVGMCCTLIPEWEKFFVPGIVIGAAGIIVIILAFPLYSFLVKRKRKKIAPEILRISDELMK